MADVIDCDEFSEARLLFQKGVPNTPIKGVISVPVRYRYADEPKPFRFKAYQVEIINLRRALWSADHVGLPKLQTRLKHEFPLTDTLKRVDTLILQKKPEITTSSEKPTKIPEDRVKLSVRVHNKHLAKEFPDVHTYEYCMLSFTDNTVIRRLNNEGLYNIIKLDDIDDKECTVDMTLEMNDIRFSNQFFAVSYNIVSIDIDSITMRERRKEVRDALRSFSFSEGESSFH